jgi:uncharacterized RDD family membrane protein YckC
MADQLVSGEGVAYELSHAGVGSRTVAAVIDLVIQFVALVILLTAYPGGDSAASAAVGVVVVVLVIAGYPIVLEWLTRGRTLGKLCLGLRVVRDDGGPIGFRQALVRGLAGLVVEKPGLLAPATTVIGFATMMFSSAEKRVGDMMAGTFVLNERAGAHHSVIARDFYVPFELQPWAAAVDLNRLDDQLALGVRQFVLRAREMTPAAQGALGEQLRAAVLAVVAPPPPAWAPTPAVLVAVLAERRRRGDAATWSRSYSGTAPGPSGPVWSPQPPAHPIVASPPSPPARPPAPAVPSRHQPGSPFAPPS